MATNKNNNFKKSNFKNTKKIGKTVQSESTRDHPIQILKFNGSTKKFQLNINELDKILNSPDVRDANIAVVSIAGAFRKGKSFMLSFFLRYLNETYTHNREHWLGSNYTPLSGFAWRGGSQRHTTGIWVWSKIFTKVLPTGEKIGVMLMDTQGTFDECSTVQDNVTIFSLSIMLSSVQIYNLFHNIQEDDLQHLQLFTEYGKLALDETAQKAFQMLLFLVRDWSCPYETPYGFAGGRKYLKQKFKVSRDRNKESADLRNHLTSCFEKLDCILMPHPGKIASVSPKFTGQLKQIDNKFKEVLKELVPALLAPENILLKKINGATVKGKAISTYIRSYWKIFKNGNIPMAKTILGATSEANVLAAHAEASEYYHRKMQHEIGTDKDMLQFGEVVDLHGKIEKESLELFRSKAIIGDEQLINNYYNKLKKSIQNWLLPFLGQNEAKKTNNLKETVDNLLTQIEEHRSASDSQSAVMKELKAEMKKYKAMSDAEKEHQLIQIEKYRKSNSLEKQRLEAELENYIQLSHTEQQRLRAQIEKLLNYNDAQRQRLEAEMRKDRTISLGGTVFAIGLGLASIFIPALRFLPK